ncbi:MAG: TadE family protein [Eubacteriales bacterium]
MIKDKRGQALVELALVLPLLILMIMGIMEFGRIFHSYLLITNAAREGARLGVVHEPDSVILTRVKDMAVSLNLTDSQISITPAETNAMGEPLRVRGVPLTVKVDYNMELITPMLDNIVPNPIPLSASSTMRVE